MATNDPSGTGREPTTTWKTHLGTIAAWVWTIFAAGGGAMLLFQRGPGRLTNGWFALASGLAVCPATAWCARRLAGISISGRTRFLAAFSIWLAGQFARRAGL